MILVIDASVALTWFFGARPDEEEAGNAVDILHAVGAGRADPRDAFNHPHFGSPR